MNKRIVKKIVLFGSILLFFVGTDTYGCGNGPCIPTFIDCGYPTNMGTCVQDGSGCGGEECGLRCPSTDDHWGCAGLLGSCTMTTAICAEWEQPFCTISPPGCRCYDGVPQGTFCIKAWCQVRPKRKSRLFNLCVLSSFWDSVWPAHENLNAVYVASYSEG